MRRARRILIVEDDPKTAASIDIYLRHGGFRTEIVDAAGSPIARMYVMPPDDAEEITAEREIAAVDRRLILLFAIAALVALALTALISRRITRPIEQLTEAVREMGRGGVRSSCATSPPSGAAALPASRRRLPSR
ncbi:MAG TPA: hypothetical protein VF488_07130 [Gemmatimonadaceae bacterium]